MGSVNPTTCCSNIPQIQSSIKLDLQDLRHMDWSTPDYEKKVLKFSQQFVLKLELNPIITRIVVRIITNKQDHLLSALQNLETRESKTNFLRSVEEKNLQLVDSLHYNLIQKAKHTQTNLSPCDFLDIDILDQKMRNQKFELGIEAIRKQQVCIFLLAGGSNHRFTSTKFLKPIPQLKKTILELMFMRLNSLRKLAGNEKCPFHVFIMCNTTNYRQIKQALEKKQYFKFPQQYVQILIQTEIPVVSLNGQVIVNSKLDIVTNPRGTAEFIHLLNSYQVKRVVFNTFVKYLSVSGMENILEKPCDPLLLGQMISEGVDIASKCVDPLNQGQQILRYAKVNGIVKSIQPQILIKKYKTDDDIRFQKSPIALNTAIFKIDYIKTILQPSKLHLINKQIHSAIRKFSYMDLRRQKRVLDQDCYIFQNHLGDLFLNTRRVVILKVKREEDYAPVITETEEYSIYSAWSYLQRVYEWRKINPDLTTLRLFREQEEYQSVIASSYKEF